MEGRSTYKGKGVGCRKAQEKPEEKAPPKVVLMGKDPRHLVTSPVVKG